MGKQLRAGTRMSSPGIGAHCHRKKAEREGEYAESLSCAGTPFMSAVSFNPPNNLGGWAWSVPTLWRRRQSTDIK